MISVILPAYNEEKDVLACLESLDKQTGPNFEVLFVDDGSTDKTLKIVKKFKPKKFSLKILRQKHKGAGSARNKAALKAKGSILVFVDSDMTFDSSFLKQLTLPISKGASKGTFSKEEYVANWENVWARCWNYNEGLGNSSRHPKKYPNSQKVFRAILKSEFDKVDGFSKGGYTDDWSLSKKLGYMATSANRAVFYHSNPSSLNETFKHAQWVAKRKYKFGPLGALLATLRSNVIFSLLIGTIKSIKYKEASFIIFKLIYDIGISIGIIKYVLSGKGQK